MLKRLNMQWTGKTLANHVLKENAQFDCAVQRGFVWDNSKDSLLIHSMIVGYPIPAFFFLKREDGKYDALDGKQRSAAISNFVHGNYSLCDSFEIIVDDNGAEHDFSGMTFEQLPEWAQDAVKDYSLTIYYFESLTIEERDSMFFRLNNGKPLSAIELTRVRAKSLEMFQEMAKHELVNLAVTEKGRIRYNHENLAMQAWAVIFADDVAFDTKTFRGIVESARVEQSHVDAVKVCFDILLDIHSSYNSQDRAEKRKQKRIVTRTHTVALTKATNIAISRGYDMEQFKAWAKIFFSGTASASICEVYNGTSGAGSARKDKVDARMGAIVDNMTTYFAKQPTQHEQLEVSDAEPTNDIILEVPYITIWDCGREIETTAKVNIQTGEVTDIVIADDEVGELDICERQYIVLNDEQVDVYDDEGDFDFWADINSTY